MSIELQKIWMANRKTVFFITHSILESVFLSDRVLVMSARPGRFIAGVQHSIPAATNLRSDRQPGVQRLRRAHTGTARSVDRCLIWSGGAESDLRNLAVAASSLVGSLVVGFVLWEIAGHLFQMPSYVLPSPRAVLVALADGLAQSPTNRAGFWYHLDDTLDGDVRRVSSSAACSVWCWPRPWQNFARSNGCCFPTSRRSRACPRSLSRRSTSSGSATRSNPRSPWRRRWRCFPVLLNALQGFLSVDRDRLELMASLDASRWQTFWLVKLPAVAR